MFCLFVCIHPTGTLTSCTVHVSVIGPEDNGNITTCAWITRKCEKYLVEKYIFWSTKTKWKESFRRSVERSVVHELKANGEYSRLNYQRLANTADTSETGTNNKSFLPGEEIRIESVLTVTKKRCSKVNSSFSPSPSSSFPHTQMHNTYNMKRSHAMSTPFTHHLLIWFHDDISPESHKIQRQRQIQRGRFGGTHSCDSYSQWNSFRFAFGAFIIHFIPWMIVEWFLIFSILCVTHTHTHGPPLRSVCINL